MTDGFLVVIVACTVVTLLARAGGYLVFARVKAIPHRANVALEAVPAAVLTTLFAPTIFSGSWREAATLGIAALLALRFGTTVTVLAAAASLIALRAFT